jgi:rhodanese-related sulfurtransferase
MKFLQDPYNLVLIALCVVTAAMLVWPLLRSTTSPMKAVTTLGATRLINSGNAVLLDLREKAEYEAGRLPNAIHIPLSQLKDRTTELAKFAGRPLVAYCERGQRTRTAAGALAGAGFTDLYHLDGGIRAWKDAGLPIES